MKCSTFYTLYERDILDQFFFIFFQNWIFFYIKKIYIFLHINIKMTEWLVNNSWWKYFSCLIFGWMIEWASEWMTDCLNVWINCYDKKIYFFLYTFFLKYGCETLLLLSFFSFIAWMKNLKIENVRPPHVAEKKKIKRKNKKKRENILITIICFQVWYL